MTTLKLDKQNTKKRLFTCSAFLAFCMNLSSIYGSTEDDVVTALSIDGGGIRGVLPAAWVGVVESITKKPIHKTFDYIAGTSIGGISALHYAAPGEQEVNPIHPVKIAKFSANELVRLFTTAERYKIFTPKPKGITSHTYSATGLEGILKENLRWPVSKREMKLSDCLTNVLVTSIDRVRLLPLIFKSFDSSQGSYEMWKIGRATSAAPIYFTACELEPGVSLVDGGLYLNNPSGVLLDAIIERGVKPANVAMLSLGTGQFKSSLPEDMGVSEVRSLINSLMAISANVVEESMKTRLSPDRYLRINPNLSREIDLAGVREEDLSDLQQIAASQIEAIEKDFEEGIFRKVLEKKNPSYQQALSEYKKRHRLYMVYRNSSNRIMLTSSKDGLKWSIPSVTNNGWETTRDVSLVYFDLGLIIAHVGRDNQIWLSISDAKSTMDKIVWSISFEGIKAGTAFAKTNRPVSFAVFGGDIQSLPSGGKLYIAYTDEDNGIWVASSEDGTSWSESIQPATDWEAKGNVSLAAFKDKLVLVHVGTNGVYLSCSNDGLNWFSPKDANHPNRTLRLDVDYNSSMSISLAVFDNYLYLATALLESPVHEYVNEIGSDRDKIFKTTYRRSANCMDWVDQTLVSIASSNVALAPFDKKLYLSLSVSFDGESSARKPIRGVSSISSDLLWSSPAPVYNSELPVGTASLVAGRVV